MMNFRLLRSTLTICFLLGAVCAGADQATNSKPLVRVVDLNVGESQTIRLCNGKEVSVKLIDLRERRDSIRQAIREARVAIEVDGQAVELTSATYHLPIRVGDVQIDCSITGGYNSNGSPESWALDKDARLRLWPADSPLLRPGTFAYPVKQRWFASLTQMCNVPTYVDGCERPSRKDVYYHNGLDIGGCEGLTEVVAATDGLVVSTGIDVLPEHRKEKDTPVSPRYDVVYVLDARGWYYRYSHLNTIDDAIKPGRLIKMGDRIGLLGKEGGSGGWSHLHFGIKARQPSGRWGEQEGYAFLWEAYLRQYKPKVIAVARPHRLIWAGDTATLDASKSRSVAGPLDKFEWQFTDGTTAEGAKVERMYEKSGCYSEVLKVTDVEGNTAYDFAVVQVIDGEHPDRLPPMIHPNYWPTQDIRAGDSITFKVRTFGTTDRREIWDFGDGSPRIEVQSDGNIKKLDPDGYAVTTHSFKESGDYVVRVERTNRDGVSGIGRLHVRVGAALSP
ncbi:MAG: peptidoglycan DD-metalloendopeptidase family protein [Planctomycetes bacterium]|nr:peptidoglycan DD-metalloendopeptidase family protein [Planctomycetota bacterium]